MELKFLLLLLLILLQLFIFLCVAPCLRDVCFFKQAYIDRGAIAWPGNLDLAPDAMYEAIKKTGKYVLQYLPYDPATPGIFTQFQMRKLFLDEPLRLSPGMLMSDSISLYKERGATRNCSRKSSTVEQNSTVP